ncbi:GatB/YqeY domain-containing protein [Patescibacteria group bacterium]
MITDSITKKINEAMKAHDEIRLSTLKLLSSALNYEFIEKQHKLSEEEELVVVMREAKKRKEAIEAYQKAGAQDRAEKEQKELEILQEYLPAEIDEKDLEKLVDEAISYLKPSGMQDMGKVVGWVKEKTKGAADGSKIAQLVKSKLV